MVYGLVFSITTIVLNAISVKEEVVEVPKGSLSVETKLNKITLSYKF
jgi:hypothetical protein